MSSLARYLDYLHLKHGVKKEDCDSLRGKINRWKKIVLKLSRNRDNPRKTNEMVVCEDVKKFSRSSMVQNVKSLFDETEAGQLKLNKHIHSIMRNYLLLVTLFRSSCRAGVLANLEVKDFQNAQEVVGDDKKCYIVEVPEHKTFLTHGSARICLDEELHKYYQLYLNKIRNVILSSCGNIWAKHFFLSWTGKKLKTNEVNKSLKAIWGEAGLKSNIGSSLVRRTVTTEAYQHEDIKGRDLIARLHCHNPNTAQTHYRASTSYEQTMEASNKVAKIFFQQASSEEEEVDDLSTPPDLQRLVSGGLHEERQYEDVMDGEKQQQWSARSENAQEQQEEGEKDQEDETAQEQQEEGKKDQEDGTIATTHENFENSAGPLQWHDYLLKFEGRGRGVFNTEERRLIFSAFKKSVMEQKLPRLRVIRKVIENSPELSFIKEKNLTVLNVKGSLLALITKRKKFDEELKKFKELYCKNENLSNLYD